MSTSPLRPQPIFQATEEQQNQLNENDRAFLHARITAVEQLLAEMKQRQAAQEQSTNARLTSVENRTTVCEEAIVEVTQGLGGLSEQMAVGFDNMTQLLAERLGSNAEASTSNNKRELEEELRLPNLLIYRLPEEAGEDAGSLWTAVINIIAQYLCPSALSKCSSIEQKRDEVEKGVVEISRVGEISSDGAKQQSRAVKIRFTTAQHKMEVFQQAPKLKDTPYQHLSLDNDLTESQQYERSIKIADLCRKTGCHKVKVTWCRYDPTRVLRHSEVKNNGGRTQDAPLAGENPSGAP